MTTKIIRSILLSSVLLLLISVQTISQSSSDLPFKYEELNAPDFVKAVEKADSICIIPLGILEKHGPHLPLGTDMLDAREVVERAVKNEYALVFPQYYFGQIYEAKHQPGTIAYSEELVWELLEETCDELGRNGIKKIVLVNGHGGNRFFLHYFCQAQLAEGKDHSVILFRPETDSAVAAKIAELKQTEEDGHAGETETSMIMAHRPDLAKVGKGDTQSGENLNRLKKMPHAFTGIWWYARYPNHYSGDGSHADKRIGNLKLNSEAAQLVELLKYLKENDNVLKLQKDFYKKTGKPLETEQ